MSARDSTRSEALFFCVLLTMLWRLYWVGGIKKTKERNQISQATASSTNQPRNRQNISPMCQELTVIIHDQLHIPFRNVPWKPSRCDARLWKGAKRQSIRERTGTRTKPNDKWNVLIARKNLCTTTYSHSETYPENICFHHRLRRHLLRSPRRGHEHQAILFVYPCLRQTNK